MDVLTKVFPNIDLTTAGGFLQLIFVELGFIVIGFAAATLVAGWASDETSGRLELVLSSPLTRRSWAVRSGIGVYLAIVVMTAVIALGIGLGALAAGSDARHADGRDRRDGPVCRGARRDRPGRRRAVPGVHRRRGRGRDRRRRPTSSTCWRRPSSCPDWFHQLALTAHLGQPMIGTWDWAGMAACVVLAVGGLALAGWGMRDRDIAA